ncbi:MAG: PRC-barrel domain-containing protein [Chloroflexota bacterium]|nr:PRC-barrel domain-containing protein [Chloroflexota bacterium]
MRRPTMRMKLGATVQSIALGATVRSADGEEVGTIDQLVVDAHTQTIESFILRTGRFYNHDYVVPIETISREDADHTLHLAFTAAQVRTMPEFAQQNFVVAENTEQTEWRYLIPAGQTGGGGVVLPTQGGSSGGGARVYDPGGDGLFGVEDPTDETVMTESNLGVWDYRVGTGTKVVTRDGHTVGALHTVEIDADGKPTGIVVVSGLLHHDHRAIPLAQIHSADAEHVVLTLTRDAYEGMAV